MGAEKLLKSNSVQSKMFSVRYTSCWGSLGKCYLKARWGGKKSLGGMLRDTLGIKKIKILNPTHCPGGLENGFYAKNGGKKGFLNKNSKFVDR